MAAPTTRRLRQFEGRDRWVVLAMLGIPTILHVGLVWIPTVASILLSFTDWNGIRFSDMNWVGLQNYQQIVTAFRRDFFQALINNSVLLIFLFIGPTALGIFIAYMLDRDIRGTRFFQGIFFTPVVLSLAVVGFMWQSVIYSTENGLATHPSGRGTPSTWPGIPPSRIPTPQASAAPPT